MTDQYFVLACPEPFDWEDSALLEATPLPSGEMSWCIGRPFGAQPSEPIDIMMDPAHSDRLLPFYDVDAILMPRTLTDVLLRNGVANLDIYVTKITHPITGFQTTDYIAANLIGLVSATDLSNSRVVGGSSDHRLDTDLEGFAIETGRTRGALMFRLAENTSAVLVHEKIKRSLEQAGFDLLQFVDPADWVG